MKDKALDPAYFSTRAAEGTVLIGAVLDLSMLFWLGQTHAGCGNLPSPPRVFSLCVFACSLLVLLLIPSRIQTLSHCAQQSTPQPLCAVAQGSRRKAESMCMMCEFGHCVYVLDVRFGEQHLLYKTWTPPSPTH